MELPARRVAAVSSLGNGVTTWAMIGLMAYGAYKCSEDDRPAPPAPSIAAAENYTSNPIVDAREAVRAKLADTTYEDQGAPYGCTDDCSGHSAGYEWAAENDITDPSDCGGNSQSFIEGCEAYGEAYQRAEEEAL